jgi:hypothetical protein
VSCWQCHLSGSSSWKKEETTPQLTFGAFQRTPDQQQQREQQVAACQRALLQACQTLQHPGQHAALLLLQHPSRGSTQQVSQPQKQHRGGQRGRRLLITLGHRRSLRCGTLCAVHASLQQWQQLAGSAGVGALLPQRLGPGMGQLAAGSQAGAAACATPQHSTKEASRSLDAGCKLLPGAAPAQSLCSRTLLLPALLRSSQGADHSGHSCVCIPRPSHG